MLEFLGNKVEEMFLSKGHVWRAGSQGKPANVVLWHLFKKSFKSSRQRGVNLTLESFVIHRRSQDGAVAGIQVNEGRIVYEILLQLCVQMRMGRIFQIMVYMQPTRR